MTATDTADQPTDLVLQRAIAAHQAGQFDQAEALYLNIVQVQPYHAVANHNLGLLAVQLGQAAAGLPYLHKALSVAPDEGQFWLSYADGLLKAGELEQALDIIETAIGRGLDNEAARTLLERIQHAQASTPTADERQHLVALYQAGQFGELEHASRALTVRYPASDFAWSVLGTALQCQGKDAFDALRQTVALAQGDAEAHGNLGLAWQQRGNLDEAVASYRQALALAPDFVEAQSNLAAALRAQGAAAEAEQAARRALTLRPDYAKAHINLASALMDLGRAAEAQASYGQALALQAGHADAALYYDYGQALQQADLSEQAVAAYQQALALEPDFIPALRALGLLQCRLKNYPQAIALCERAIALQADDAQLHLHLALVHEEAGNRAQTLQHLLRATELAPDESRYHLHLADHYHGSHRHALAVAAYRRALAIAPDDASTWNNLGTSLQALKQFDEASAAYERSLALAPDHASTLCNLGANFQDAKQLEKSREYYTAALQADPQFVRALFSLGNSYMLDGEPLAAIDHYRRALAIQHDYRDAYVNLSATLNNLGRLDEAIAVCRDGLAVCDQWDNVFSNYLFLLAHSATVSATDVYAEHRRFGEVFERRHGGAPYVHANSREPARQLKVGFISGDLHNHPVPHFILPVLEHMAGDASLSLYAYHNDPEDDFVTERLRALMPHWRQVQHLADRELIALIRDDGIDVLIDLSGHTGKNRLAALAAKPAPIQASWVGYPATTGLRTVDYYISDPLFSPPGMLDHIFSESLMLLPLFAPFLPSEYAPPVRPAPALSNGYITFGSFNRLNKINRQVITLWSRLLRAVPDARMLLAAMPQAAPHPLLVQWFAEEGIAAERLMFEQRTGMSQYMAMHHRVDICLDTYPYAGGTTTFHALWMGVPTLTLGGDTQPSRAGAWILQRVELDDFVARDEEDFVRKGVAMAANPMLLGAYRLSARLRLERSPIGNANLVAEGLSHGLRQAWQRWCAGLPAATFEVVPTAPLPSIGL